jgi:hypothetical protein
MESHNKGKGFLVISLCIFLLCVVGIAFMVSENNKSLDNNVSEVVTISDGSINIPNTNQTCLKPNITDDGFYCNVDDIVDR